MATAGAVHSCLQVSHPVVVSKIHNHEKKHILHNRNNILLFIRIFHMVIPGGTLVHKFTWFFCNTVYTVTVVYERNERLLQKQLKIIFVD